MQPKPSSLSTRKVLIWSVAIICLIMSFTAGWLSYFLVPLTVVLVPLYVILQLKVADNTSSRSVRLAGNSLTTGMLGLYLFTPSVNDTNDVLLLGFMPVDSSSAVANIFGFISTVGFFLTLIAFVWLGAALYKNRKTAQKATSSR
jgi:hypothetical protein